MRLLKLWKNVDDISVSVRVNVRMVLVTRIMVDKMLAKSHVTVVIAFKRAPTFLYTAVFEQLASVVAANAFPSSSSLEVSLRYAAYAWSSCGKRLTKSESARG